MRRILSRSVVELNSFLIFFYIDTGASKLIAEGKIKLKNDSQISHFTSKSIVFQNGSELEADLVVVFAVG